MDLLKSFAIHFLKGNVCYWEYTSIKISKELSEKLQLIKKVNNYKSVNEMLDKTVNETFEAITEPVLFFVGTLPITFNMLHTSELNTAWRADDLTVTVLFKDTNISLGNICFKLIRIKSIVENEVGNKF